MVRIVTLFVLALVVSFVVPSQAGEVYYDDRLVYDSDHPDITQPSMLFLKLQLAITNGNGPTTYTSFAWAKFGAGGYDCANSGNCWTQADYQATFPHLWNRFTPAPSFGVGHLYSAFNSNTGVSGEWVFSSEEDMWPAFYAANIEYSQVYTSVTGEAFPPYIQVVNSPSYFSGVATGTILPVFCVNGNLYFPQGTQIGLSTLNGEVSSGNVIAFGDFTTVCPIASPPTPTPPPTPNATPDITPACNPGYQYANGLCYPSAAPPSNPPIFDIINWLKSILSEMF